jgi:hypothetical protein
VGRLGTPESFANAVSKRTAATSPQDRWVIAVLAATGTNSSSTYGSGHASGQRPFGEREPNAEVLHLLTRSRGGGIASLQGFFGVSYRVPPTCGWPLAIHTTLLLTTRP